MSRPRAESSSGELQVTGSRLLKKTRYRIVVMGAAGVGKSCIISRLLYEKFLQEYKATIEELHSGQFEMNGLPITLDILDTSGSFEFPAMRRLSISTGDAFILVYSVDDQSSFTEVERVRQEIVEEKGKDVRTPIVIVGNKTDLDRNPESGLQGGKNDRRPSWMTPTSSPSAKTVERATLETVASIDWGHGYVEVSAKDDDDVTTGIFKELLAQVNLQLKEEVRCANGTCRHFSFKGKRHDLPKYGKRNSCHVS